MPVFTVTNNRKAPLSFTDARMTRVTVKAGKSLAVDLPPAMAKTLRSFSLRDKSLSIEPTDDEGRSVIKAIQANQPRPFRMAPSPAFEIKDELADALAEDPDAALSGDRTDYTDHGPYADEDPDADAEGEEDPAIAAVKSAAAAETPREGTDAPKSDTPAVRKDSTSPARVKRVRAKRPKGQ